jgi:hypothetical protein
MDDETEDVGQDIIGAGAGDRLQDEGLSEWDRLSIITIDLKIQIKREKTAHGREGQQNGRKYQCSERNQIGRTRL